MLALNIILLIASVALFVVGLILTWKPNPAYLIIYPDIKVKKFYTRGMFFLFFMATFSGLTMLILDNKNILIISVCCLFLSSAMSIYYYFWYYKNISKEAKQKQSKERALIIVFEVILAIILFISFEWSLILFVPYFSYFIYSAIKYMKRKLYIYKYFLIGLSLILLFYLSIAFRMTLFYGYKKMLFTYDDLSSAQGIILFLILLFMFLFILDIKKHSPIYEKKYLEENSLQPNVSNNP